MSDLISRSELLKRLEEWNTSDKTDKALYNFALHRIIEQPTAYDIDKVVEELEEIKGSACDGKSCSECEYTSDCLEGEQSEKVAIDKAIEIVNHGCVGTETETIRDKAVKWNNNSSKRVPYEFIDYVEGKREIGVSDDVCEWRLIKCYKFLHKTSCGNTFDMENNFKYCPFCGKKIKIVGD